MQIIISVLLGVFIGAILMGIIAGNRITELTFERDWYKGTLVAENLREEKKSIKKN